jgi:glycosyltransferase involved in cell wall biosynthesis
MISGNPYAKDYGGVAVHVKYLISFLSNFNDLNIDVVTFGQENNTYQKNNITYSELKRMRFGKILFPFELLYDLIRLKRVIKKLHPDIIHIQSTIPLFSFLGLYLINDYNILLTLHGYVREEYKVHVGFKKIVNMVFGVPLERFALSKIPRIITVSPQIKDFIIKKTNSKIIMIPNGIDLKYIQKIQPANRNNNPIVFYLGMLTKGKGIADLIKSISVVKKDITNVKLFIGGSGPYEDTLRRLVTDFDLEENVTFLGFLNEEEKFSYMKSIDLFILPSHWESFPIVLLEAMACGKPIIATDIGGVSYAVNNGVNGYLYEPGDVKELTNKIIKLLSNKELMEQMGKENQKKSLGFNWKSIAEETKKVYFEILKK